MPTDAGEPKSFGHLIAEEDAQLEAGCRSPSRERMPFDRVIGQPGSAEEPWVAFTNRDRFGLALSGGGIRSATFNLGLLQALRQKGLLDFVDYFGTVSGGGYVGGFWTAWRQRSCEVDPKDGQPLIFPKQTLSNTADGRTDTAQPSPKEIRERSEIRHLREFSRFLMPRVGFMDAEAWNGVVAIVFGLLPSLVVTLSVLGAALSAWLLFNALVLNCRSVYLCGGAMFMLHVGINMTLERRFWKRHAAEDAQKRFMAWLYIPLLLSMLLGLAMGVVRYVWDFHGYTPAAIITQQGFERRPIDPSWGVFVPAIAWLAGALLLLVVRLFCNSQPRTQLAGAKSQPRIHHGIYVALALDRGIARCLAPAVLWATLGGLWMAAVWLRIHLGDSWSQAAGSGGLAAIAAGFFAWSRNWLEKPVQATNLQTLMRRLKPVLPQFLAYVAVGLLFVLVSQIMLFTAFRAEGAEDPDKLNTLRIAAFGGTCAVIICFALRVFDLSNVGLHEFYRGRIARCFLGAANPEALGQAADKNRQTDERQGDDLRLGELPCPLVIGDPVPRPAGLFRALRLRPIHLICCAANNLAGDPLGTLYRGARSAVLSQRGITIGNETAGLPDTRLSSALTASAAAFNSNMGAVSMYLGLPVTFLMTALNLRLGLWLPHPRNPIRKQRKLPGTFFFLEMFGRTFSDSPPSVANADPKDPFKPAPLDAEDRHRYVHLSDGAHFENLSVYELIRRHCRYIVVSDCGADPQYSFDDLANTIRRVREDFGVEIELDFSPLKPDSNGYSQQHVVAGVIHYDGVIGCDKGTLLYFKPTLTGNEPCDVLQYKTRNSVFPQESTGDQFYDEAQWEAYRRLGEHSGYECFPFVENLRPQRVGSVESVFHTARVQWQPGWQGQSEQFLALTARCSQLEAEVREQAPAFLRAEFFPEVVHAASSTSSTPRTLDDEIRSVYFLMLAVQIMEDAWLACRLDSQWSHPLNEGWMGYFHRWASTPSFRRWWPIIKPIYSPGFREFVKRRFDMEFCDVTATSDIPITSPKTRLLLRRLEQNDEIDGFAWRHWARSSSLPLPNPSVWKFAYELLLATPPDHSPLQPLQVGIVFVHVDQGTCCAHWTTNEFYVPPALEGAGFIGRFLDALINYLHDRGIDELRVTVLDAASPNERPPSRADYASRARRVHLVDFYKGRGFNYDRHAARDATEFNQLCRRLN